MTEATIGAMPGENVADLKEIMEGGGERSPFMPSRPGEVRRKNNYSMCQSRYWHISTLLMMKKVIEIQNIKRNFQVGDETVHALRGVSFNINEGEFVTIMGTSGSGKSTLLNILGCLDTPTSGEYLLDDIPCTYDEQASTCGTKKPEDWVRVPKLQPVA